MKTKTTPKKEPTYKHISRLGLTIHESKHGTPYVRSKELDTVLTPEQRKKFSEYYGVQTCLALDDGTSGLYPYDVEAVFVRMFDRRLTGTQLIWD